MVNNIEFYEKCSEILNLRYEDHSFKYYRRTRWNNRKPGNGRFEGYGLIRCYGDKVHVSFRNPSTNKMFNSKEDVLNWLSEGMVTYAAS